jgi:hypothetical protein
LTEAQLLHLSDMNSSLPEAQLLHLSNMNSSLPEAQLLHFSNMNSSLAEAGTANTTHTHMSQRVRACVITHLRKHMLV